MSAHEHGHVHDSNCDCGCHHHHDGEDVINNALILSRKGEVRFEPVVPAETALARIIGQLAEVAALVAVDGVILGHIKALLVCAAGKATVSITRASNPDITLSDIWDSRGMISACELSINVLSLANTDAEVEPMVDVIFAGGLL